MDINSLQFLRLDKLQIPLVNLFYRDVYKKGMANKSEQVFVLRDPEIRCAARIKNVQGALLLTGVACDPAFRQQGLASYLIQRLLQLQQQAVYCFPSPQLQSFYQQLEFTLCAAERLPEKLFAQYQGYQRNKPLLCMIYDANKGNKSE